MQSKLWSLDQFSNNFRVTYKIQSMHHMKISKLQIGFIKFRYCPTNPAWILCIDNFVLVGINMVGLYTPHELGWLLSERWFHMHLVGFSQTADL